uniref:Uncharacterized protein n=1 Tax=Pithovirus LCDPAC02 TaxID=2506601 RepID=A0A481YP06_9VIRU|nr:MAG: hypothetical protein LCDPAC02_01900 [Pithovirus LCDPAC02]
MQISSSKHFKSKECNEIAKYIRENSLIYRKMTNYENKFLNNVYKYQKHNNFYKWLDKMLTIDYRFYDFIFFIDGEMSEQLLKDDKFPINTGLFRFIHHKKYNLIFSIKIICENKSNIEHYIYEYPSETVYKIMQNTFNNFNLEYIVYIKNNSFEIIKKENFDTYIPNYRLINLDITLVNYII